MASIMITRASVVMALDRATEIGTKIQSPAAFVTLALVALTVPGARLRVL